MMTTFIFFTHSAYEETLKVHGSEENMLQAFAQLPDSTEFSAQVALVTPRTIPLDTVGKALVTRHHTRAIRIDRPMTYTEAEYHETLNDPHDRAVFEAGFPRPLDLLLIIGSTWPYPVFYPIVMLHQGRWTAADARSQDSPLQSSTPGPASSGPAPEALPPVA